MSLNFEELKQVFREEEEEREKAKKEIEFAKLELAKAREERQLAQSKAKIELMKLKEARAERQLEEKQRRAEKQQQSDNLIYFISIGITFLSILSSVILFIIILLKG